MERFLFQYATKGHADRGTHSPQSTRRPVMQRTRLTGFRGWLTAGLAASLTVLTAGPGPPGGRIGPTACPSI